MDRGRLRWDESGRQVWSRDEGYPGDASYREFYRDIGFDLPEHELLGEIGPYRARVNTGLKYHRVTAPGIDLADKDLWDPDVAKERAWTHDQFTEWSVESLMSELTEP